MPVPKGTRVGGRQKGVPNKSTRELKEIAARHGPAAIKEIATLAGLVDDGKGKAESEQARVSALNMLLDRGYGKPAQTHAHAGEEGVGPVKIEFSWQASKG